MKSFWANDENRESRKKRMKEVCNTPEHKEVVSASQLKSWKDNSQRKEKASVTMKKRFELDPDLKEKIRNILSSEEVNKKRIVSTRKRFLEDAEYREKLAINGKLITTKLNERYRTDPEYKEKMDKFSKENLIKMHQKTLDNLTLKEPLLSPDGKIYSEIKNINEFALEHKIDPSGLYKVFNKKLKSINGWKLKTNETIMGRGDQIRNSILVNENNIGEEFRLTSIKEFCDIHSEVNEQQIGRLVHKKTKKIKGWFLKENINENMVCKKDYKGTVLVNSITKEELVINSSLREFCKTYSIFKPTSLLRLLAGSVMNCKEYTVKQSVINN